MPPLSPWQVLLGADPSYASRWGALDDVVMGGVSSSSLNLQRGAGEGGADAMVFRWGTPGGGGGGGGGTPQPVTLLCIRHWRRSWRRTSRRLISHR